MIAHSHRWHRTWLRCLFVMLPLFATPAIGFAQSVPVGGSYITNGDFENGLINWIDKGSTSLNTASPLFGTQSLRLTASPGGRSQSIKTGIEPGATIRVSGYGKVAAATDLATLGVEFYNAANVRLLNQWIQVKGSTTKFYTFDIKIPNGTAEIQIYTYKNSGNQPADFDNLNLTKVANP